MAKKKTSKKRTKAEEPEITDYMPRIDPDSRIEDQVPLNELPTLFPNSYEVVVAAEIGVDHPSRRFPGH